MKPHLFGKPMPWRKDRWVRTFGRGAKEVRALLIPLPEGPYRLRATVTLGGACVWTQGWNEHTAGSAALERQLRRMGVSP
jgi:hypothetical protein